MALTPFYKPYSASYSRLLLYFIAIVITLALSSHLFNSREFYIPARRISPTPAVGGKDQQPILSISTESVSSNTPETTPGITQLPCQSLKGLEDIFLIVRTGASEALDKLPVHFNTTLRCLPSESYGIWSDLEETIDGHHVGNVLDEVSPGVVQSHPDFEYYRRLQEDGRAAFSAEELAEWASAKNSANGRNTPGWKLDKWKFLPLARKAYQQRPTAKWFIFTECDSFINWTSLLTWLSHHDPSTPYVGQKMVIGDVEFAYGGASFVVSNDAMKSVTEHYAADVHTYEDFTGQHWAGDCVLGKALKDAGVDFAQAWPTFSGDSPFERDFNSSVSGPDHSMWCYNAMTWHHMTPSDIRGLSEFEEKWTIEHSALLRHADVFRHFLMPKMGSQLESWDNLSSDDQSVDSLGDCRSKCASRPDCIQFAFHHHNQKCKTSTVVKLGQPQDMKTKGEYTTSGWLIDRVEAFALDLDASCHGDGWLIS